MNTKRNAGFTLIELLVVIAIIAILAAILFPVFAKVREKARQASCTSNMKQVGLALLQYSEDYDETLPIGTQGNYSGHNLGVGWAGQAYPYIKSTGAFQCPDDATPRNAGANPPAYPVSYAYNTHIANSFSSQNGHIANFTNPSKTVMLCEVKGSHADITDPLEGVTANPPDYSSATSGLAIWSNPGDVASLTVQLTTGYLSGNPDQKDGPLGRHSDGSNWLAADGHVKWIRGDYVSAGRNAAGWSTAAPTPGLANCAGTEFTGDQFYPNYTITFSPI